MQVEHNQRVVAKQAQPKDQRISRVSPETTQEQSDIEQAGNAPIPAPVESTQV